MVKRHLVTAAPPPPRGVRYHHASEADGWLHVTGQLPTDPADPGAPFAEGIEAQAEQTFRNLRTIVEAAGYSLADTVFVRIYLADFDRDYDGLNRVYHRHFADDAQVPSRTTVGVARLGRGALVEIELVLGGGPAGAWAAVAAVEAGASVVLADKGRVGTSGATASANTAVIDVAAGSAGWTAVLERRLARGCNLVRADTVERVLEAAHRRLSDLAAWGYGFPLDDAGALYRGTLRGPDYMQLMRRRLHKLSVRILDHHPALRLLTAGGRVAGAEGVARAGGGTWRVQAGAVVIATGGCAFMSRALGTFGLTGDGLLMGAEAGAALEAMEFSGQYGIAHSAATVTKNLIYSWATFSDAAGRVLRRGEGGEDDLFALLAEHLPRGPVYAVIDRASPAIREGLRRGQPNIFLALDRQGIDPFTQRFPVTLRYEGTVRGVGGLAVDPGGATNVPGLFAAGDAASRQDLVGAVSGGGGPNSTWAIASGTGAGGSAAAFAAGAGRPASAQADADSRAPEPDDAEIDEAIAAIQREMFPLERNFIRDRQAMQRSLAALDGLWSSFGRARAPGGDARSILRRREAAAMAASARWIYAGALARRESRGIHRRRDHPAADPGQATGLRIHGLDRITAEFVS